MSDEELNSKLTEELNNEVNEENIDLILEYMKNNVDVEDLDTSDISYEVDENGNYVILIDKFKVEIEKGTSVNDSLYSINTGFGISDSPVDITPPFSNNEGDETAGNNSGNSSYRGNRSNGGNSGGYNIAIDLEAYSDVIDKLSACDTEMQDEFNNNYETNSLSDKLLNFYNSHYGESYVTKINDIKSSNKSLLQKVQTSLMYYLSIDQNLVDNMDSMIDSIFSGDYQMMQMMYQSNGNDNITYDQYLTLMKDNEEFFNIQRCQYLSQFMMQFDSYAAQFRTEAMPQMLNNFIESFFYGTYRGESADAPEAFIEFKDTFAKIYVDEMKEFGFDGVNCPENINSIYFFGSDDNPTSLYDKVLINISYNGDEGVMWALKETAEELYGETYLEKNEWYQYDFERPIDDLDYNLGSFEECYRIFNELCTSFEEKKNEYLSWIDIDPETGQADYSALDTKKINEFYNSFVNDFYYKGMESLANISNYDKDWDEYFHGILLDDYTFAAGYHEDRRAYEDEAFAYAYALLYGNDRNLFDQDEISQNYDDYSDYIYEQYINGKKISCDENLKDEILSQMANDKINQYDYYVKVIEKDGYDGLCKFLTFYYDYMNEKCKTDPIAEEGHIFTIEDVKQRIGKHGGTSLFYRKAMANSIYDYATSVQTNLKNQLASIKNTQETYEMYFAKRLDKSSVTDEKRAAAREKIKAYYGEGAFNYIEDWQIDAYAVMLDNASSLDQSAYNFCHGNDTHPRGALDNIIVQGRAFDSAKDDVDLLTSDFIFSSLMTPLYGLTDGVGGFIEGIKDAFSPDGEYSENEYRQQFLRQLLTTDYSAFADYKKGLYDDAFGCTYDNVDLSKYSLENNLDRKDVEDMIAYARENEIPKFELEHMLGIMTDEEYTKLKSVYDIANGKNPKDIDYYAGLADKAFLARYTNVLYSVGEGVGNMAIPLTLNILSAYCPILSYASIGLTSLSTFGKTQESLLISGETDQTTIFWNSFAHALIEGAGEAVFGSVLKTTWGEKILKFLQKIPVLGKVFTFTDDIISKIDDIPFGSDAFKAFLKSDLKEICEELGENVWGYLADGFMLGRWPTGEEILAESWQTIWQTALTTPILDAFKGCANRFLKKTIVVNGLAVTLSLSDIESFTNEDGSIDAEGLLSTLVARGDLIGEIPAAKNKLNRLLGSDVVQSVEVQEDEKGNQKYVVKLNDGNVLSIGLNEFNAESDNLFSKIANNNPQLLLNALNNETATKVFIKKLFGMYEKTMIPGMIYGLNSDQMISLVQTLDLDTATEVVKTMRPGQANQQLFIEYSKKLGLELDEATLNKYIDIVNNFNDSLSPNDQWKRIELFGDNMSLINLMTQLISGGSGDVQYGIDQIFPRNGAEPDFNRMASKVLEILSKANPKIAHELATNKTRMQDLADYLEDEWNKAGEGKERAAILAYLDKTFKIDLRAAYENAAYYEFIYSLGMTYEMSQDGAYDIPYPEVLLRRYLARRDVIQETPKEIKGKNGNPYTEVFPKVDSYISNNRLVTYMEEMAGKDNLDLVKEYARKRGLDYKNDPIACWGEYLGDKNNPKMMIKGITFQSASQYGGNYIGFGGNIGRDNTNAGTEYNDSGGYMMRIIDYETLARDYPDLCEIRTINGEKQLYIKDYERFGNEVVGGVVMTNGIYVIETEIPINEVYLTMNNDGAFTNYGAPGGYLHRSYGIETTVPQQRLEEIANAEGTTTQTKEAIAIAMTLQPDQVVNIPIGNNMHVRISRR